MHSHLDIKVAYVHQAELRATAGGGRLAGPRAWTAGTRQSWRRAAATALSGARRRAGWVLVEVGLKMAIEPVAPMDPVAQPSDERRAA